MINIISGDLFQSTESARIIVHGCNAQGVMKSGFAKSLKAAFPEAYEDYLVYYANSKKTQIPILGTNVVTKIGGTIVISAITQQNYGRHPTLRYVSYDAVYECLNDVLEYAKYCMLPIHMPFIGGGLAHGDHDILMTIFEKTVGRYNNTTLFIKEQTI